MEKGSTPGGIRAFWLNVRVHSCGFCGLSLEVFGWWICTGWELFLFLSLVFFLFSLFIDRKRLQHCPVLEWLQGKPNVSLAFSSFCAVYPPQPPHLSVSFLSSISCFFCSISIFYLPRHSFCFCLTSSLSHFSPSVCSYMSSYNSSFGAFTSPLSPPFLSSSSSLFFFFFSLLLSPCRLPIPTGRGCSPLTWLLRP